MLMKGVITGIVFCILLIGITNVSADRTIDITGPTESTVTVAQVNVTSTDYWDALDVPTDISGSEFWYNQSFISTYFSDEEWILKNNTNGFNFNESKLSKPLIFSILLFVRWSS